MICLYYMQNKIIFDRQTQLVNTNIKSHTNKSIPSSVQKNNKIINDY